MSMRWSCMIPSKGPNFARANLPLRHSPKINSFHLKEPPHKGLHKVRADQQEESVLNPCKWYMRDPRTAGNLEGKEGRMISFM